MNAPSCSGRPVGAVVPSERWRLDHRASTLLAASFLGLLALGLVAPAAGADGGVWITASCWGPISYSTDTGGPLSLFPSTRYLLVPVPGHLASVFRGPIYFVVFKPDGSLVDEPLGPFHNSALVSYQKLANGLPSVLCEDERAADEVGGTIADLQKVILSLSRIGRRIARELAIEYREITLDQGSVRLPRAGGIRAQWNIDANGGMGFVATTQSAYLLEIDRTGAVDALWEWPLDPVAEANIEVTGRSLFSRSGEAVAIGIVETEDYEEGESTLLVLQLAAGERGVKAVDPIRLDGVFLPAAISDAGGAVALASTSEIVVVSVASRSTRTLELAPIELENGPSASAPDRIDTGHVDLVHGVANAATFKTYRLLDDGALELAGEIDLSVVAHRLRKDPVRAMSGDGAAILVTAPVVEGDTVTGYEHYVLDRRGSVARNVDDILRPAENSAAITLRSTPGRNTYLLVRGAYHEFSQPVRIGLRTLD